MAEKTRALTKSLGAVNWAVTLAIGLFLVCISPVLARYWVNAVTLTVSDVTQCLVIMSVASAIQFPIGLYTAGLAGLQRQVAANVLLITFGTLSAIGSVFVLSFISPTIQAFLIWQTIIAFVRMIATIMTFYSGLPRSRSKISFETKINIVKNVWRFAAGNMAISLAALVIAQTDKIVLSKMISLEEFGYYSLSTLIASTALVMLVNVVSKVAYPQFSRIVALHDDLGLRKAYHQNSQLVSVLIVPTTFILAFFSREILFVWTANETMAIRSSLLLTLYAIGTGLSCLMWIPYYAQLAHGWTRLALYKHLIAIVFFVPFLIVSVYKYGAVGGAASWVALNSIYLIVYIGLMHRRILVGEMARWFLQDIGIVVVAVLPIVVLGRLYLPAPLTRVGLFIYLSAITLISFFAASLTSPFVRKRIVDVLSRWRS